MGAQQNWEVGCVCAALDMEGVRQNVRADVVDSHFGRRVVELANVLLEGRCSEDVVASQE